MVSGRGAEQTKSVVRDAGDVNGIFPGQDMNDNSQLNVYYIWFSSFFSSPWLHSDVMLNDGIST